MSEQAYEEFLTAVAKPVQRNFTLYWLGRAFDAGGTTFNGPTFAPVIGSNSGDEMQVAYEGKPAGNTASISLDLYALSSRGWESARASILGPAPRAGREVTVGNHAAMLYEIVDGDEVNERIAVFDLSDGLAVATTHALRTNPAVTPNANPLIDEATFLSVLQNLRPYPN